MSKEAAAEEEQEEVVVEEEEQEEQEHEEGVVEEEGEEEEEEGDGEEQEQHSVHDAVRSKVVDPAARNGFQAFRRRNFSGNTSVPAGLSACCTTHQALYLDYADSWY